MLSLEILKEISLVVLYFSCSCFLLFLIVKNWRDK